MTDTKSSAPTSEGEFLRQMAEEERRAISETLERIERAAKDTVDVKAWARDYPWPTIGVAAAAGFLTASVLASTARGGRRRRFSGLMDDVLDESEQRPAGRRRRSTPRRLISRGIRLLSRALQSSVIAAVAAKFQQPPSATEDVSGNGHHPAENPN